MSALTPDDLLGDVEPGYGFVGVVYAAVLDAYADPETPADRLELLQEHLERTLRCVETLCNVAPPAVS